MSREGLRLMASYETEQLLVSTRTLPDLNAAGGGLTSPFFSRARLLRLKGSSRAILSESDTVANRRCHNRRYTNA